jgi:hypothetical protein
MKQPTRYSVQVQTAPIALPPEPIKPVTPVLQLEANEKPGRLVPDRYNYAVIPTRDRNPKRAERVFYQPWQVGAENGKRFLLKTALRSIRKEAEREFKREYGITTGRQLRNARKSVGPRAGQFDEFLQRQALIVRMAVLESHLETERQRKLALESKAVA